MWCVCNMFLNVMVTYEATRQAEEGDDEQFATAAHVAVG